MPQAYAILKYEPADQFWDALQPITAWTYCMCFVLCMSARAAVLLLTSSQHLCNQEPAEVLHELF